MPEFYINNDKAIRLDSCDRFIYEVTVFVWYENIYSMINHKYFSSEVEIEGIIENHFITPKIEICCEIYSAPKRWLIENDFILYIEPEKKKRKKKNE